MTDKRNMRYTYKIYKISSDYCDKFYIGSTRDFTTRKSKHKNACNNPNGKEYNCKKYVTIRNNLGWDNWRMTCIEVMENTTKLDAEIREEQMRMSLNAKLNDRMATRGHITKEEYQKQYYAEHKDYHKEYQKQHYEANKDHYKELNKKYKEEHKDHLKEYNKLYREENGEQLRAQANQKHDCKCGGKYTHTNKASHSKTIKHQLYLDTLGKSI